MDNNNSAFDKDDLYKTLDRINLWTVNSDMKTSVAITALGVISVILLSKDYIIKFKTIIATIIKNMTFFSSIYLCFTTFSIILICVGCFYLYRVLVPRTNINLYKQSGIQTNSLLFFSSVANINSFTEFRTKIEASSEDILRNDLISQIYICSKICDVKFKNYKKGITITLIGFSIFVCLMIVGVMITM